MQAFDCGHRLRAFAQVEVDQFERHIGQRHFGHIGQGQQLGGLVVVERVQQRVRLQVQRFGVTAGQGELGQRRRIQARQVEFERDLGQGLIKDRRRRRSDQVQVGRTGQIRRHTEWQPWFCCGWRCKGQRNVRSLLADPREFLTVGQALRRGLHGGGGVGAGATRGNLFDPFAEVAEHPAGEVDLRGVGRSLIGQVGVEHLLADPRGFAELLEPDHARAALEGVEGAPQKGQQGKIGRRAAQVVACLLGIGKHLARLFEEDLAHLVVVLELGVHEPRQRHQSALARCGQQVKASRFRRGRDEVNQRFGQLAARCGDGRRVGRCVQRLLGLLHGRRECRLLGHAGLVRQQFEFA